MRRSFLFLMTVGLGLFILQSFATSLTTQDTHEIKQVIQKIDHGFRNYSAEEVTHNMSDNVVFVNQYGRIYYGKTAVTKRHISVLDRSQGHVGTMPPATYSIDKIVGLNKGAAVVTVNWEYPKYPGMPKTFDPHNPMKGVFAYTFFKTNGKWKIAMAQNTPYVPDELNAN